MSPNMQLFSISIKINERAAVCPWITSHMCETWLALFVSALQTIALKFGLIRSVNKCSGSGQATYLKSTLI